MDLLTSEMYYAPTHHIFPSTVLCIDVVAVKGGSFPVTGTSTGIIQRDLLCTGTESTLLQCPQYDSGTRDCPADHSEDARVRCNGTYTHVPHAPSIHVLHILVHEF